MIRPWVIAGILALTPVGATAHLGETSKGICHESAAKGNKHCHDENGIERPWPPVKKSRSGICHDWDSQWYEQTLHFEPFNSLKECLDSGGRLPKT